MNLAGKILNTTAALALFFCLTLPISAQTPQAPQTPPPPATATSTPTSTPAPPPANSERPTSITVEQIVARQEAHYNLIKNIQGIAVHSETKYTPGGQPQTPESQTIYFAFEGDKSVTLAMPQAAARAYGQMQGEIPWEHVTAATLIHGDTVFNIRKSSDPNTTIPTVMAVPYNPAVHDNNPILNFHPRQIADEQLPLRELARGIPAMAQRPVVSEIIVNNRQLLRIDFANAARPGEHLYYLIDPHRGYLPVQISRVSNNKPLSVSNILLAPTPEGYWMPARRERITYTPDNQPATRQTWHYDHVAVNKGLAPMALTLMYFNLAQDTKVTVVPAN